MEKDRKYERSIKLEKLFTWKDMPRKGWDAYGSRTLLSIPRGELHGELAKYIIEGDYSNLTHLRFIFTINEPAPLSYGAIPLMPAHASDTLLLKAYSALSLNTHIHTIDYDHFPHSLRSLNYLLYQLSESPKLPLKNLSLVGLVQGSNILHSHPYDPCTMLDALVVHLNKIILTHSSLTILSLSHNFLGQSENAILKLAILGKIIAGSRSLQVLDLSNNQFTFEQAMLLLNTLIHNTNITTLKLTCISEDNNEKTALELAISNFTRKNQALREQVFSAIINTDVEFMREYIEKGGCLFYQRDNMNCLEFIEHLINNTTMISQRVRRALEFSVRRKSKDDERLGVLANNSSKLRAFDEIKSLVVDKLTETKNSNSDHRTQGKNPITETSEIDLNEYATKATNSLK